MILDTSVVAGLMLGEPQARDLREHVAGEERLAMGAPTLAETGAVLEARLNILGWTLLRRFVEELGVTVIPFTAEHARVAVDAFTRFGRGRHPAALNFGDCLTYATAMVSGERLLCLDDDFARTDIALVVQP